MQAWSAREKRCSRGNGVRTEGGRRLAADGFSLIELLIVISILGVLAALMFPTFVRARESARRSICLSNLRQIGLAMQMYAADWDSLTPRQPGRAPNPHENEISGEVTWDPCGLDGGRDYRKFCRTEYTMADLLMPYLGSRDVTRCPSVKDPDDECFAPYYQVFFSSVRIDWGPRRGPAKGDVSATPFVADVYGTAWGSNHTPDPRWHVYFVNVLYLDGHTRGRFYEVASDKFLY